MPSKGAVRPGSRERAKSQGEEKLQETAGGRLWCHEEPAAQQGLPVDALTLTPGERLGGSFSRGSVSRSASGQGPEADARKPRPEVARATGSGSRENLGNKEGRKKIGWGHRLCEEWGGIKGEGSGRENS